MGTQLQMQKSFTSMSRNSWGLIPPGILQRKCACGGSPGLTGECSGCQTKRLLGKPLQGKLRINEPGDVYEQEADRVAEQVMRMAEPNQEFGPSRLAATALVQRRIDEGGDASATNVQRQEQAA